MQMQSFRLLLTFANSLDPDQAQHNFKTLAIQMVVLLIFFSFLKKISEDDNNKMKNFPSCKVLTYLLEKTLFDLAAF